MYMQTLETHDMIDETCHGFNGIVSLLIFIHWVVFFLIKFII